MDKIFGRLTLQAFKHDFLQTSVSVSVVLGAIGIIALLTYTKRWKWLWSEWITTLDPKKIGVMYAIVASIMLLKGVSDAGLIRMQQAFGYGASQGFLTADHFQQIFSAHGTTMIFFVGMGFIFSLMNLVIPLQIGARDVAFPFLNATSFWLFASGASLIMISLIIGDFSIAGWVAYPPLSELEYSAGEGVDYWIWSVQIAGVGSLLSGINFWATIIKMRCPGMTYFKMPILMWSLMGTLVLILFAFPILTATVGMLALDRVLHMNFFTSGGGGNSMMYINLIWAWGHPEVYILVLPAFGIFSEVVSTFARKRLFGYMSMVWAIIIITLLSFIVWVHHFFTMGAGPKINAFFGIMTMLIAIPTGVKLFNWLFTMYRGRTVLMSPMLWFLGFVFIFTLGGMSGILMSIAPVDFQVHNSLFLIAHFHSTIIGAVLFGFFAGITFWFPKILGFKLNERLGRWAFYGWFSGFIAAFFPLYVLGLMGVTRRLNHYANPEWRPLFLIAALGFCLIACGIGFQILQIIVSVKERKKNMDTTGDPWDGRTLDWMTKSPPPVYNFAVVPEVHDRDAFWIMKEKNEYRKIKYEDIHVPKNSGWGFLIGSFSLAFGFAIIWHIHWLTILGFVGMIACLIARTFERDTELLITKEEVAKMERGTL